MTGSDFVATVVGICSHDDTISACWECVEWEFKDAQKKAAAEGFANAVGMLRASAETYESIGKGLPKSSDMRTSALWRAEVMRDAVQMLEEAA